MIILSTLSIPSNSLETWAVGGSTYSWGVSGLQYITNVVDWNSLAGVPRMFGHLFLLVGVSMSGPSIEGSQVSGPSLSLSLVE